SVANQVRFILDRDSFIRGDLKNYKIIKEVAMDEIQLAKQMYQISKEDSRIGFEASNHYYYFPLDFVEKVINCEYILKHWKDTNY
ncbi:MAG: hypothetical protein KAI29_01730, partial [Cyclobacteriaceae bacterium]|nr:hypothetical protein [Cyclobacteriaceae bacterium]